MMNLCQMHRARNLKYMHDAIETMKRYARYNNDKFPLPLETYRRAEVRFFHYWKDNRTQNVNLPA